MLTSLIITLQSSTEASLPANLGRAAQAALLALIDQRDPALAKRLHADDGPSAGLRTGPRPYTASNLVLGKRRKGSLHIKAGQAGWLRFTGLTAEVSSVLQGIAADPPDSITMIDQPLAVTGATLNPAEHLWANQISYQDLAAPYLLGGQEWIPSRIELEFAGPTTFRSRGRYVPLPLPELVFGSLLNRWETFAPVALHPEVRRFAEESVVLSRYRLRTRGMPYKQGGVHIGFIGNVTFSALNRDRYWLSVLNLLAAFAFYSGVGYGTAAGLGQTRAVER